MNPRQILVIEDDIDIRESLVEVLESENHQVVDAGDGLEALEKLESGTLPDLILTDLMMPRMNGWEFLGACQKNPRFADIPIIIISALANWDTAVGAAGFIRKPFDLNTLFDNVKRHSLEKPA